MKVTDPVCGMQIESDNAAGAERIQGWPYYFCSAQCRETFRTAPDSYVDKASQGAKGSSSGCCQ